MNDDRILDIFGGLHLLDPSQSKLSGTLDYLKDLKPKTLHACHCTDLRSKIALANAVNLEEVGSGMVIEYL
jgi:7,8-dihydropterin-6-yl-methyl-4-(beta-D-ribofuranosyl)aminobenzene 5'-phosphate synthase